MAPHFFRQAPVNKRTNTYRLPLEPGTVRAGDALTLLEAAATTLTIQDLSHLLTARTVDVGRLADVLALPHLPAAVRQQLTENARSPR